MKRRPGLVVDIALSLAILTGVWCTRALAASQFVTWDEPAWVYRSIKFLSALQQGDLAGTSLVGHPGVTVMWSGTLSLLWHTKVSGLVSPQQLRALGTIPALDVHDPTIIRQLVVLLPAAKQGILILHALIAVALYWLLARLLDRRYALVVSFMLCFDPYYLGLSRVLHMDALASGLMLCAVVGVLLYTRQTRRRYLVISAIATALATLTKSYGVLVAPMIGLLLLIARCGGVWRDDKAKPLLISECVALLARDLAFWTLVAVGVFVALWPAMWVSPMETLRSMMQLSVEYAVHPGDATASFFRGAFVRDPGALFYPTALFFRITPLVMAGVALVLVGLSFRDLTFGANPSALRPVTLALLGYVIIYLALITISKKKFDRYLLPALLGADLLAAVGLMSALDCILRALGWRVQTRIFSIRRTLSAALSLALVGLQSALLLAPLAPSYYLAYYNPWAGGSARALETIPVGWGEGIERAAEYLARKPNASDLTVATWAIAGVAGVFPGQLVTLTEERLPTSDYVLIYIGDVQSATPLVESFRAQTPEFVVTLNGVEYAWLYANTYYQALSQEMDRVVASDAVIIANMPSTLQRHYRRLPYTALDGDDEAQIARQLRFATSGAKHIVFLEYQSDQERSEWIARQLAQNALLLWSKPFAYGTIHYYALPDDADFHHVLVDRGVSVNFDRQLMLDGYGFSSDQVEYRQELGLGLSWHVLRPTTENYHLFAHLVDGEGRKWGQRDLPLSDANRLRTAAWEANTAHLCNLSVPIEAGTPPGEYWVEIGLYRLEDLARLSVFVDGEQERGASFRLGPVHVAAPAIPPDVADLGIPHPLEAYLGDVAQIWGYDLVSDHAFSGDTLGLTLFWQCAKPMNVRYDLGLSLVRNGVIAQTWRLSPAGSQHPTNAWVEGEILRYPYELPLDADLTSGDYSLVLNLYPTNSDEPLSDRDVNLATVFIEHRERLFSAPSIQYPSQATLGDEIGFLGYDLASTSAAPNGVLQFTLYWRTLRRPDVSYTVFTHLLDEAGVVRGQRDSIPLNGQRPTDGWMDGEVLIDRYELPIAANVPLGPYRIEIGMYNAATGERLSVRDASGASVAEQRILLAPVIVVGE